MEVPNPTTMTQDGNQDASTLESIKKQTAATVSGAACVRVLRFLQNSLEKKCESYAN